MLVRTETALTYAGARVALDAALARGEQLGGAFNVAVTDTAGGLLAFARMDGAFAVLRGDRPGQGLDRRRLRRPADRRLLRRHRR